MHRKSPQKYRESDSTENGGNVYMLLEDGKTTSLGKINPSWSESPLTLVFSGPPTNSQITEFYCFPIGASILTTDSWEAGNQVWEAGNQVWVILWCRKGHSSPITWVFDREKILSHDALRKLEVFLCISRTGKFHLWLFYFGFDPLFKDLFIYYFWLFKRGFLCVTALLL